VRFRQFLFLLAFPLPFLVTLGAQESARVLPRVSDHAPIEYTAIAQTARVEGPVRLKITTDGHAVSSVAVMDGPPLLVKAATKNAQTWKFVDHVPGTFDVTFDFRLLADKTAGHNFGDELGFSTTVRMKNSQPTRVSLIGRRRSGDRIQGVFLNESGISGTWSAKIISHGPPGVME
jgi:hypothetical protein